MNSRVKRVKTLTDYQLALEFENTECRVFDMKPNGMSFASALEQNAEFILCSQL